MKKFAYSVCLIAFISTSTYGLDVGLQKPGTMANVVTAINEFSQFEMPMIKISTATGTAITSKDTCIDAKISVINKQGVYEMTDTSISIRLRGNVTLAADKKSYKVKFVEKQNILNIGVGNGKTWCLISNCYDGSLLRNLTVYRMADSLNGLQYSPNCLSVELFINNEYQGVYLLCEDVNVNTTRVEIEQDDLEIEKNGYLIEMSRHDEADSFTVDKETYRVKSHLPPIDSIKRKQIEYISGYITKCINALKNGDRTEVEQYVDLQSLVDIYIVNEIAKNVDVGWSSFYLFKRAGKKIQFGPPWDFDLALGNANCVKGFDSWAGISPYHVLNINANSNPWFCYALGNKWFRDLVQQRWAALKDKISKLPKTVTTEAETNYKSYCRNFEKWNNILGKQVYIEPKQIVALKSFKDHYTYLSDWLDKRITWLTNYYSTDDFLNGVFPDDSGKAQTMAINLVAVSSILAIASSANVKMTYEMLPTQGVAMAIENGGTQSWETQIAVTGFMFEKGEQYEISFDYKCSAAQPLPFDIQQNHKPYKSFFYEAVNSTGEFQHYQTTFTVSKSDYNCAFAFSLGGTTFNGTEITINNMSVILKKSSKVNKPDVQGYSNLLKSFFYDSKREIVRLNLPSAVLIDIHLYTINGREVYALSEKKNAGEQVFPLNGIKLAPGAYTGLIKAGSQAVQWKMIIEK
jgi:hypothetical protein